VDIARPFHWTIPCSAVAWPAVVTLAIAGPTWAAEPQGPERWEPQIQAFEEQDLKNLPPQDAVVFVGSSSIRGWDLKRHFPELTALNRGFGGSQIPDSTYYADRIVIPYKPNRIVLYAGDNDIAAGRSPEQVASDFGLFVEKIHGALPEARIVFIAIKPSISRWALVEKMRAANEMIRTKCAEVGRLDYVDIDAPMIGGDGKPRAELFKEDGLHLNEAGYTLWTEILTPYLAEPDGPRQD